MIEVNLETISASGLPKPTSSAMSAIMTQNGADMALSISRCKQTANNSQTLTELSESDRTDDRLQTSPRGISNKVREAFMSRLKLIPEFNAGYYIKNTEFLGEVQVVDVEKGSFSANLTNSEDAYENYHADFSMDEVPFADHALVKPGALFFWEVGQEITNGTVKNITQILFRRMASVGKRHLSRIKDNARTEAASIRSAIVEA